jgi:hypothetical protein
MSPRFRPRRLAMGLYGESFPSLPAASIEHLAAARRTHSEPESVLVLALPVAGLEGAFHSMVPFEKVSVCVQGRRCGLEGRHRRYLDD